MARLVALTTKDNPFDPIDNFKQWWLYDVSHGYNSCSWLADVAKTSDILTPIENYAEINRAIDRIIALDLTDTYRKYVKEVPDEEVVEYLPEK